MKTLKVVVAWILAAEARALIRRGKPRVVMVTGSVGKTGTKDAIAAAISAAANVPVRASEKSLNSEIGLPLTILGLENGWRNFWAWAGILLRGLTRAMRGQPPPFLVLEVGVDRPGDMDRALSIVTPEVAVATVFADAPVHGANFPARREGESVAELVAYEKAKLFAAATRAVVVNADHPRALAQARRAGKPVITFGAAAGADFQVDGYEVTYAASGQPSGFRAFVAWAGGEAGFAVEGVVGEPQALPAAAAAAVCRALDLPVGPGVAAAASAPRQPGRARLIPGRNGSVIVDDSYNASPVATAAAIRAAASIKREGRLAILLGDMRELGAASAEAHREVGMLAAASGATLLVTVGEESKKAGEAASAAGCPTQSFADAPSAGEFLKTWLGAGDVLLAKGSQGGIRLERAVERLLANPEDAALLPRRGKEWERIK